MVPDDRHCNALTLSDLPYSDNVLFLALNGLSVTISIWIIVKTLRVNIKLKKMLLSETKEANEL